jgi:hypothetical protein
MYISSQHEKDPPPHPIKLFFCKTDTYFRFLL